MKKKITLSVSEFAIPAPLTGSIDTYSGFSEGSSFGMQIHQEIQQTKLANDPHYEAEVWCAHKFKVDKYIFEIVGKMDGIYHNKNLKIEEIKSGFDLNKLHDAIKNNDNHPYCLQLKTYGYFKWLKTNIIPELNLHLVSARNGKTIDLPIVLDVHQYEAWLKVRLAELMSAVKQAEKRIKKRKKAATEIVFPFPKLRTGQAELIETIEEGMKANSTLLIQAPTGLGKTIGVLYPVLKESLSRGQKVVYVTPKNSQHRVAFDAVKTLQKQGAKIKSLTITAKKKLCLKQEPICNAEYCEFAENYYTKVRENNLIKNFQKQKNLTFNTFKKIALEHQVCPYELQMETVADADVVICDYNYVFSPRTRLNNPITKTSIGEHEKPNLTIDEVHNLPNRSMDYYSPTLSAMFFEKLLLAIENIPNALREQFSALLHECSVIIRSCQQDNMKTPHLITPPINAFTLHDSKLRDFLAEYLMSDVVINNQDMVLATVNLWNDFTQGLEWIANARSEFFTSYIPKTGEIKITCCDASEMLKANYSEFAQVVAFSATLKPFEYYTQLIGLQAKKLHAQEFVSPFSKTRRKLLVIPQVSSRYNHRERNYPRIATVIHKIAAIKPGNYFAFFPSFEFMENVLQALTVPTGFNILWQKRNMLQQDVQHILDKLTSTDASYITFAVQGGLFSEGIDYPGKLAIGAFIVGAPLPNFDWERERKKEYYEKHYQAGMDYAYIYPAMAKAVQSAGRVIRSEDDKGIIVLMDDRYLHPDFSKCMPRDWFANDPNELISTSILQDVKAFWHSFGAE